MPSSRCALLITVVDVVFHRASRGARVQRPSPHRRCPSGRAHERHAARLEATVRAIAEGCSGRNTVRPDTDAMQALSRMQRLGASRLMVTDAGRLVGIFSVKDVMKLMALRVELDDHAPGDDEPPSPREVDREFSGAR